MSIELGKWAPTFVRRSILAAAVIAIAAPLAAMSPMTDTTPPDGAAERSSYVYEPTDALIVNPERGLYTPYESLVDVTPEALKEVVGRGESIIHLGIDLSGYETRSLHDGQVLAQAQSVFELVRAHGLKAWMHVSYSQTFDPKIDDSRTACPDSAEIYPDVPADVDAPLEWVQTHLGELREVFAANTDVIMGFDAGFIGEWGEWHCSANQLLLPENKLAVLTALLENLPADRQIALRHPYDLFDPSVYRVLDPTIEWWDAQSRLTSYQDCYAASDPYDEGTWALSLTDDRIDQAQISVLKEQVGRLGENHLVGGVACNPSPRSTCEVAVTGDRANTGEPSEATPFPLQYDAPELPNMHFTYLNGKQQDTANIDYQNGGCWTQIQTRLGYRLQLDRAELPTAVRAGERFELSVGLSNVGWASIINPRPAYLVLQGSAGTHRFPLAADPRTWKAGETAEIVESIVLPSMLPSGEYTVGLWLPDAYETLHGNPAYSVQFANVAVWDGVTGYNVLGTTTVDATLPATGASGGDLLLPIVAAAALIAAGIGAMRVGLRRRAGSPSR